MISSTRRLSNASPHPFEWLTPSGQIGAFIFFFILSLLVNSWGQMSRVYAGLNAGLIYVITGTIVVVALKIKGTLKVIE